MSEIASRSREIQGPVLHLDNELLRKEEELIEAAILGCTGFGKTPSDFFRSLKMLENLPKGCKVASYYIEKLKECDSERINSYEGGIYFFRTIENQLLQEGRPFALKLLQQFQQMQEKSIIAFTKAKEYLDQKEEGFSIKKLVSLYKRAASCGSDRAVLKLVELHIEQLSAESLQSPVRLLNELVDRYYTLEARAAGCLFFKANKSSIGKVYRKMYTYLTKYQPTESFLVELLHRMNTENTHYEENKVERRALYDEGFSGYFKSYKQEQMISYIERLVHFAKLYDERSLDILLEIKIEAFDLLLDLLPFEVWEKIAGDLDPLIFRTKLTYYLP